LSSDKAPARHDGLLGCADSSLNFDFCRNLRHAAACPDQLADRAAALQLASRAFIRPLIIVIAPLSLLSVLVHVRRFTTDAGDIRWTASSLTSSRIQHPILLPGRHADAVGDHARHLPSRCRAAGRPDVWAWRLLACIFVLLSIDKSARSELVGYFIQKSKHYHGLLYFSWVIPRALCADGGALLREIPAAARKLAIRFVISGAIYVGGAWGWNRSAAFNSDRFAKTILRINSSATSRDDGNGRHRRFIVTLLNHSPKTPRS